MTQIEKWQFALPKKRLSITISPELVSLFKIQGECLMALVFDYTEALLFQMYQHAFPSKRLLIAALAGMPVHCSLDGNSNITIRN